LKIYHRMNKVWGSAEISGPNMTNAARFLVATCCLAWLLSCATRSVETTVETHHRLGAADLAKRVVVLPAQKEKADTLEFAEYAKLVEDGLRRQGFQIVPVGEPTDLVAFFGYGIDQGHDELYSYAIPQFGQTGIQSSQTLGTVQNFGAGATYNGTTTYTPSYGVTGWTPQVGTRRLYTRAIALDIYDISQGDEPIKLYESLATSQGSSGALGEVIDEVLASLFQNFQATGVHRTSVPMKP
jgi:hypothetical protein